jgi:hypothetical protein
MTSQFAAAGPAEASPHATAEVLASYAAGTVEPVVVWSVEGHLTGCASCRAALSAYVDAGRLARNRSVLMVRAATPDGRLRRLIRRCGVPDYLLRLLAATPSLRLSWLLSVVGVLAAVAAETTAAQYYWLPVGPPGIARPLDPAVLVPLVLIAPLLVLASVSAAFLPMFDPASRLAVAAPFSGFSLLLVRAVSALAVALIPAVVVALVVPGPGWLPVGLLLPSLALCAVALAAATVVDPRAAAVAAGALWILPALLLAGSSLPLAIVQWRAQYVCAAVLCGCAAVLFLRRDRFELGWMR